VPLALLVVSLLVALFVADHDFGEALGARAIQPYGLMLVYAGAFFVAALSVRALAASLRVEGWIPLPLGRYLLPLDLVEVRPGTLTIRPFGDARDVRVDEDARRVTILYADSTTVEVTVPRAAGPSLWVRMLNAQHDLEEATLVGRAKGDPLAALRGDDGFDDAWRARAVAPAYSVARSGSRAVPIVIGAACVALGWGVLRVRNVASDDAMFARARASNGRLDYEHYLRAGGRRHADVVRETLLPRAALDEAESQDTLYALRAFRREFPWSNVDTEARERFAAACKKELARAETLDGIQAFEENAVDCALEDDVAQARLRTHELLFQTAEAGGIGAVREYARRYPNGPLAERASAALHDAYARERNRVSSAVQRGALRTALVYLVDRSEIEGHAITLFVPIEVYGGLLPKEQRATNDAFDRGLRTVLDPATTFLYHPASLAEADAARGCVLHIATDALWTGEMVARYELAYSGQKDTWSVPVDKTMHIGDMLARGALVDASSSRPR
jgi:hypothetical protein